MFFSPPDLESAQFNSHHSKLASENLINCYKSANFPIFRVHVFYKTILIIGVNSDNNLKAVDDLHSFNEY